MTKELKPKLRFPSFEHEWTTTKLKDVSNYQKGFAFKSEDYRCSGARIIRVSDLSADSIKLDNEKIYIDQENVSKYGRYIINSGEVIITTVGSRPHLKESAVGRAIFVEKGEEHLLNQNLLKLEFDDENVSNFIFRYLNSPRYIDYITSIQRGNANQSNIAVKDLLEYPLSITSKEEQHKIADFLSSVDNKICLLKEKYDLLTQYKKGVMQKLFKQEIRFKDDNGNDFPDWKREAVGKYLEEYKERVAVNTDIPVLTSSRTGLYPQERAVVNEGEYGVVPKGYFTYRHMSDDLVFKFNLNLNWERGAVSKEYPVFKTVGMNSYFLELCLNEGSEFKRFAIQQKVGGTRTRLYFKNLVKLKLNTPCLEEQNKISEFLQAIDKKLEAVKQQIELTQTFKKGLLQQMFI